MSNEYGFELREYLNNLNKCTSKLAQYLNYDQLSLILGAGVSKDGFGLPSWPDLIKRCLKEVLPHEPVKDTYESHELKPEADKIKKACGSTDKYLELISKSLYNDYPNGFDFRLAKKDLLIALTSLMVGKVRGNVRNILTFNFDNVLEWYLTINGLNVNVISKDHLLNRPSDVDILHLHGYLPIDNKIGNRTDEIVFTKKEFEDRQVGHSYYKHLMDEFYKKHVFVSIGLSVESLIDDISPYLRRLKTEFYQREKFRRGHPYGIAFLSSCTAAQATELLDDGIIPCVIEILNIPQSIFGIAQKAMKH